MEIAKEIRNEEVLDDLLSRPSDATIKMIKRIRGDIALIGVGGKMGVSLGCMALRAIEDSGVKKKIYGISRFTSHNTREKLEKRGIETIKCDILDRKEVERLPAVDNVIYMAGRKFGTSGSENLTWAMNVIAPLHICE